MIKKFWYVPIVILGFFLVELLFDFSFFPISEDQSENKIEIKDLKKITSDIKVKKNLISPVNYKIIDTDEKINIEVYKKVSPGVVNITNKMVSYDYFLQPNLVEGGGSGSIIDQKGHILTNYHVIRGSVSLVVTLSNQVKYKAKVVGVDIEDDLAVIKINAVPSILKVISIGDSDQLEVGEKVLAIGNPFGLDRTLTTGIVSSLGRTIKVGNYYISGIIQTDAAINPGNSGGPLLNKKGELIGVNTMIASIGGGGNLGVGFAVPSDTVKLVLNDLIKYGRVRRVNLGISQSFWLNQLPGLSRILKLEVDNGLMIIEVKKGSLADRAGLRGYRKTVYIGNIRIPIGGDIIVGMDGRKVDSMKAYSLIMRNKRPGDELIVNIIRDGQRKDIFIQIGRS